MGESSKTIKGQGQALSIAASPGTKHTTARSSVTSPAFYFGLKFHEASDRPGTARQGHRLNRDLGATELSLRSLFPDVQTAHSPWGYNHICFP